MASLAGSNGVLEDKVEFARRYFTPLIPPNPPSSPPDHNPFAALENAAALDEATLTSRFTELVNQCDAFAPCIKLACCGPRPDLARSIMGENQPKPDMALFRPGLVPTSGVPMWCDQLVAVVVISPILSNARDPNDDTYDMITRVGFMFAVQQRFAVFTLLVVQRRFHLIRWDHAGFIITHPIDYFVDWRYTADVLSRISQCADIQLGLDPTAHRLYPSDPEYRCMTEAAESLETDLELMEGLFDLDNPPQQPYVFSYVRTAFARSLDPLWPRYRVEVPDGDENQTFLIGKPQYRENSLFGRATRGYVALDCETGLFVWLKDTWRVHGVFAAREGDVLMELNTALVSNVPTLLCHDDLLGHATYTLQRWTEQQGEADSETGTRGLAGRKRKQGSDRSDRKRTCALRRYQHYRLVVKEVALPLSEFQTGQQLITIVKDCVVAHRGAFEHLSLLHSDISGGNMLIYPRMDKVGGRYMLRFRGILADWEMARPVSAMPAEKIGTLSFMSVARLSLTKPVEVCDELESFAYVLLYYATRFLRSSCALDITIANYIDEFFQQYNTKDGAIACGSRKLLTILTGKLEVAHGIPLEFGSNMDSVFHTLLSWFQAHHAVSQHELREASAASLPVQATRVESVSPSPSAELNPEPDHLPPPVDQSLDDGEPVEAHKEPSADDRKLASLASSHHAMVEVLTDAEGLPGWPDDDKVGDRIPVAWGLCQPESQRQERTNDPSQSYVSPPAKKKRRTG
ncbi:hypothetical protein L226DRAFT_488335 [Lentinus tigrinus ALCF2SS1-7]|uniref:Fungal-type protein kinase domain-containing protein n=1 Tax=Lentinus tigrinus ALCF2SS1-6 TaxID=1328759 RepID=A0A5C2RR04_9APHY|nr:hypothetical protein L227DRAFT_604526 [Lentinus tigrinus ALCF2SS1-6]RPD73678.1 hypothetical protein L226DRAFT_488335 [Lentinus tigrinus ALCF2SS1-7]